MKYSRELKKDLCEKICVNGASTINTANEYNIPIKTFEKWITAYNKDNHCFDPIIETVTDIKMINNINNSIDYNDLSNEELKHELMKKDIEIERLKKKLFCERRWYGSKGIHYFLQEEYQVIFNLSTKYSINALCIVMNINRSGFYKWLKLRSNPSQRQIKRTSAFDIFKEYHNKYPSHGYRWLNA